MQLKDARTAHEEAEALLADKEMAEMAREEIERLDEEIPSLEHELQLLLLPKDAADERNAILEVRAGTGGDEASLFAAEIMRIFGETETETL